VVGQRLYLFGREQHRDAFAADPAGILREARARWPALERGLARKLRTRGLVLRTIPE